MGHEQQWGKHDEENSWERGNEWENRQNTNLGKFCTAGSLQHGVNG